MPTVIKSASVIKSAGNKLKLIEEFIGRVNSNNIEISIAKMKSPGGWTEPAQAPKFDEYTVVLKGTLRVETQNQTFDIREGQAIIVHKNEWVKYSTPIEEGAEYFAVCLPAFSLETVHREEE